MNRKFLKAKRNSKKLKNVCSKSNMAIAALQSENGSKTSSGNSLCEELLFQDQLNKNGVPEPFSDIPSSSETARFDCVLQESSAPFLRRSSRPKSAPLAWWRNQRAVYNIQDFSLVRIDEGSREGHPRTVKNRNQQLSRWKALKQAERNCVKSKQPIVKDANGVKLFADVVCHPKSLIWSHVLDATSGQTSHLIAKSFESSYLSFGFLEMLPLKKKRLQYAPSGSIHYCILKGRVEFILNDSTFLLGLCDSFIVPQGNAYSITNMSPKNTVLSFCMFKSSAMTRLS